MIDILTEAAIYCVGTMHNAISVEREYISQEVLLLKQVLSFLHVTVHQYAFNLSPIIDDVLLE